MASRKIKNKDRGRLRRAKEACEEAIVVGPMDEEEVERVVKTQRANGETIEKILADLRADYGVRRRR